MVFAALEGYQTLERYVREMVEGNTQDRCGVLVSGEKGTGKTSCVERVLVPYMPAHPVLVARHHQQHEKIPYFGFKYGISDYLSKIYSQVGKKDLHRFSRSLKNRLGTSFPLLLDYIPELSLITGEESAVSDGTVAGIENQVYPLFRSFFQFLAEYGGKPVIFFTDDLQWIDASGISLLRYLLTALAPDSLIWIGAYRSAHGNTDSLRKLDEALGWENKRIESVNLSGLSTTETRACLEAMLGGPCDEALVQACYRLSGGNFSHLRFFADRLRSEGYLRMEGDVWAADYPRMERRFSGDEREPFQRSTFERLSDQARTLLTVMVCMGRFNRRMMLDWFNGDAEALEAALEEVNAARLVSVTSAEVHLRETHVAERIYSGLTLSARVACHHRIGQSFYARGVESLSPTEFILMTINFNQALDVVRAEKNLKRVARLNYQAGKRSQQENAVQQARHFFRISAELFRECPWEEVVDDVVAVYMERARVEYELGEYDLAEIHLDYLLERIAEPVQRARIFELKITINNHLGRYIKVVRILDEALGDLGMTLPLDRTALHEEVKRLTRRLGGQETKETANPPEHFDLARRQAILKLLYVGGMGLHHNSDVLMRWAALQIILCSGKETISGVKAIGCVSYGRMLIISGEIEKGYAFGLKGLEINGALDDLSLRCRVYGVYAFYIQPWKAPFAGSYRYLDEAMEAGGKSGDLIGLYIIKTHRLNLHIVSGAPLTALPPFDFDESHTGRELTYYITHYQKSLLDFLLGRSQVFTMPRQQPAWLAGELTIQEEKFYRNYVWARYYFLLGHYDLAASAAKEADGNRKLQEGSPLLPANLYTWFLATTQGWGNQDLHAKKRKQPVLERILDMFRLWQEEGPSNYHSMWRLLKAEAARIKGDKIGAADEYAAAVRTAGNNVYHYAVSEELWARFLLSSPEHRTEAVGHLQESMRAFRAWGAVAKVNQLLLQYQALLSGAGVVEATSFQDIDMETIQHELSGDMQVSSLVKKLMVLLLRVSGSSHVVVELVKDSGDRITVEELSLLERLPGATAVTGAPLRAGFPVSLVMTAVKSRVAMVVNDLNAERGLRGLEVVRDRGVKSFLILPVTINGHLSMVIYLESVFAAQWYTAERVRWVRIAANQGAVIIENARTHERSVKLNQELRREMAERERLASMMEAQKDAHLRAVVQAQDDERKRIAADLHDSLGSLLSTVKLRFNALQEDFEDKVPGKRERFVETIRMLDDAVGEVRQISHNMLPVSLTRFGLQAALEDFVARIRAAGKLRVELQILGLDRRLPEELEVATYRICQELVQNVIKHAKATHTSIQIIDHTDTLNIIVEDDGIGVRKENLNPGFGFATIQSKVSLFQGSFEIESHPGKGTMAVVDLRVV